MSKQIKDIITQFNGGEVSPLMAGRTDLVKHENSCEIMENFVPMPHGPATRKPGVRYVANAKDPSGVTLLMHFDGKDGDSTWADAAGSLIVSGNGTVVVDTQESVFGGGSGWFSGAGNITTERSALEILGGATSLDFGTDDFTICFRIKTYASSGIILSNGPQSGGLWRCELSSGKIKFGSNLEYITSNGAVYDGVWHHVAIVRDATNTLSIYIDGILDAADATFNHNLQSGVRTYIGGDNIYGGTWFRGHLDELRIMAGTAYWASTTASFDVPEAPWGYKRMIPFIFSTTQTYVLEFGDKYIRFFTRRGQLLSGGNPYEIVSPYRDIDLINLNYSQNADTMELTCKGYAPRQLIRNSNIDWEINTKAFNSPPTIEMGWKPSSHITPAATTGDHVTFTCQHAIFTEVCAGGQIVNKAGIGKAAILSVLYSAATLYSKVICRILEDFPNTSAIAAGNWELWRGVAELTPSVLGPAGSSCALASTGNIGKGITCVEDGGTTWTQSAAVNEEYWIESGGKRPSAEPARVFIAGVEATKGTIGTLEVGQWGWGQNGSEAGGNTVYVRIAGDADPDTHGTALPNYIFYVETTTDDATIFDTVQVSDAGRYVRINAGLVRIDTVLNSKTAIGTIMKTLSNANASSAWNFEDKMWSDTLGWPYAVAYHNARLVYGGSDTYPQYVWGTAVQDYDNLSGGSDDADSFAFEIASAEVNVVRWITSGGALIVGTSGAEFAITGSGGESTPITPTSINVQLQTNHGCDAVRPVTTHLSTLFVSQKFNLREFAYSDESAKYLAPDLALIAEHIPKDGRGIIEMAYQKTPFNVVWMLLGNGELAGMTYLKEQLVTAWHRHPLGGSGGRVESIACIPGERNYYELWMMTSRIDSQGDRSYYVCFMENFFKNGNIEDAFYVDFGLTYDGAGVTSVSGLSHLNGETVKILGDGVELDDATVSNGAVDLKLLAVAQTCNKVQVGLSYTSLLKLSRHATPKAATHDQGKLKRLHTLVVRLYETLGFEYGGDVSDLDTKGQTALLKYDPTEDRFTGDFEVPTPGDFEYPGAVVIRQTGAVPCTIVSMRREYDYAN